MSAESLPELITELERADRHVQAGTGFVAMIVAGAAYALSWRVRAARDLAEDGA